MFLRLWIYIKKKSRNNIVVIHIVALTLQTHRKCFVVKQLQISSLNDRAGLGLCGKWHGERAE
jgi:hypothetical protein